MQTRSITLIVFETLSYCNNVRKTAATADSFFLVANKETAEDLSKEETIIVLHHTFTAFASSQCRMEVDGEDDWRSIHSFTGEILQQPD